MLLFSNHLNFASINIALKHSESHQFMKIRKKDSAKIKNLQFELVKLCQQIKIFAKIDGKSFGNNKAKGFQTDFLRG